MDGSSSQMSCVLRLDTQSRGWDKSMHKLFKGIRDVTYTIDATRGLAYVSGKISPEIILRIRKAKKHAQLIHMDYGYNPNLPPTNPDNFPPENIPISFNSPYNYPAEAPNLPPPPPPPPSPYNMYNINYRYNPYEQQQQQAVASPYNYFQHPYYYGAAEVPYSPPPQIPTRDTVTGEPQCLIL
ncbi:PREDICTED: leucine-rich repeat extensin-like protein 5 [Tarenaya hassleriana]|uniref:leucine-rich repeat extensin-like protein 5 n=1 Tax=Tarenaya hassleriana TaxID=28532 RepID=UPI00053C39B8|nr:PREDICTED: leucine-rich repeat extensin-like protein 5 [Tarenaya hassleriana]